MILCVIYNITLVCDITHKKCNIIKDLYCKIYDHDGENVICIMLMCDQSWTPPLITTSAGESVKNVHFTLFCCRFWTAQNIIHPLACYALYQQSL